MSMSVFGNVILVVSGLTSSEKHEHLLLAFLPVTSIGHFLHQ